METESKALLSKSFKAGTAITEVYLTAIKASGLSSMVGFWGFFFESVF